MTLTLERQPLGQLLVSRGVLPQARLDAALERQRRTGHEKLLGEILVESRECTEQQVAEALALSYGVPFARVGPSVADPQVVDLLPLPFLRSHLVLPLFLVNEVLTLAMAEPANVFLVEDVERRTGKRVQVVAALAGDVLATLDRYRGDEREYAGAEVDDVIGGDGDAAPDDATAAWHEYSAGDWTDDEAPAARLVSHVLQSALRAGAADVHFEPGEDALRVRFRLDGRLSEKLRPPRRLGPAIAARLKSLAGLDPADRLLPQEGVGQVRIHRREIDLRVLTMPGPYGEKVVVRLVDAERLTLNVEKLGFGYETLKQWQKLTARPQGLVLVTGPVGSGKKSTLYSATQARAAEELNVCTIEDPVAYAIPGVNQFQVNEESGLTFATGLRALLRQDPDVVMLGELRDAETAQLAAQAALSGQLVFAAMNTVDAIGAIPRMLHYGVEPYVLASTLAGVLAQRMVRRLCPACKEPYSPEGNERRQVEHVGGTGGGMIYRAKGCGRCRNTGYSGRLGVFELLVPDDAMVDAIGRGAPLAELRSLAQQAGLTSLRDDALEKTKAGITSLAEALRVT